MKTITNLPLRYFFACVLFISARASAESHSCASMFQDEETVAAIIADLAAFYVDISELRDPALKLVLTSAFRSKIREAIDSNIPVRDQLAAAILSEKESRRGENRAQENREARAREEESAFRPYSHYKTISEKTKIENVALSHSGNYLVLAGEHWGKLLSISEPNSMRLAVDQNAKLIKPDWSPDDRFLGYSDLATTAIFDTLTQTYARIPSGEGSRIKFSPDGLHFIITRSKGVSTDAQLYKIGQSKVVQTYKLKGAATNAGFSLDGRIVVLMSPNRVQFFETATGNQIWETSRESVDSEHITFVPNTTSYLIPAGGDLFEVQLAKKLSTREISLGESSGVRSLNVDQSGHLILVTDKKGRTRILEFATGATVEAFPVKDSMKSQFTSDGQSVIILDAAGSVHLWNRSPTRWRTF